MSGETLMWLPYILPSSGANISLNSNLNSDKSVASISEFSYNPPPNFNGIDTFTLLADEGDRLTTLEVEVHVKGVPDPPIFLDPGPLYLSVKQSAYLEYKILANDPDGDSLTFKLIYGNNQTKWLTIKESNNDFVKIAGIVPRHNGSESTSLVVSDTTGRFSILSIYIDIE